MGCPASSLPALAGVRAAAVVDFRLGRWRAAGALFPSSLQFVSLAIPLALRWGRLVTRRALPGLMTMTERTRRDETEKGLFLFTLADATAANEGDPGRGGCQSRAV